MANKRKRRVENKRFSITRLKPHDKTSNASTLQLVENKRFSITRLKLRSQSLSGRIPLGRKQKILDYEIETMYKSFIRFCRILVENKRFSITRLKLMRGSTPRAIASRRKQKILDYEIETDKFIRYGFRQMT